MDFTQWSQLALICVLGAMSPGPSLAVILRNSVSGGRTQGIMSGIGHGLGITFYAVIAIAGLVAMFKNIPNSINLTKNDSNSKYEIISRCPFNRPVYSENMSKSIGLMKIISNLTFELQIVPKT